MKTELREAMTSGVYVEFRDASGNTVGQALYTDWRGQPVPNVGDMIASDVQAFGSASPEKLCGRVISRQFELQSEPDGTPCVWVQLIVAANYPAREGQRGKARRHDARFSRN
jgi:hypothetical protein